MKLAKEIKALCEAMDYEAIADFLSNSLEHTKDADAVKHLVKEFHLPLAKAEKIIIEWAKLGPQKQLHMHLNDQLHWIKKHLTANESFLIITERLLKSVNEENNQELTQTKSQVEKIRDELTKLKVKMHTEKQAGKADSLLDGLKKKWLELQNKIVALWTAYDKKHGTKYHAAYGI